MLSSYKRIKREDYANNIYVCLLSFMKLKNQYDHFEKLKNDIEYIFENNKEDRAYWIEKAKEYNLEFKKSQTKACIMEKVRDHVRPIIISYTTTIEKIYERLLVIHFRIRYLQSGVLDLSKDCVIFENIFGKRTCSISNLDEKTIINKLRITHTEYDNNKKSYYFTKDTLQCICMNINIGDIGRLMRVCKKFHNSIINNDTIWMWFCKRDLARCSDKNHFKFYKNWFTKKTKLRPWFQNSQYTKCYHVVNNIIGILHNDIKAIEIEGKGFPINRYTNPELFDDSAKSFVFSNNTDNFIVKLPSKTYFYNGKEPVFRKNNTDKYFLNDEKFYLGNAPHIELLYCDNKNTIVYKYNNRIVTLYNDFPYKAPKTLPFNGYFGVDIKFEDDRPLYTETNLAFLWGGYYYVLCLIGINEYIVRCFSLLYHYMYRDLTDPITFSYGEYPKHFWVDSERIIIMTDRNLWIAEI